MEKSCKTLLEILAELPDPRVERTKLHKLVDIVFIAICAVISGADTWEEIADYGHNKKEWLKQFLELPHGIPSHDTFNRVFARLDPQAWQRCFLSWVQGVAEKTQGKVVSIDGKTVCASQDDKNGKTALEMVSAWAAANRLVLGQKQVEETSHEISAVPQLLELLELAGCIVTLDALHCQNGTAEKLIAKGAEYVVTVKRNRKTLYQDVRWLFEYAADEAIIDSHVETFDAKHGRYETRRCFVLNNVSYLENHGFPGLSCAVMVEREREVKGKLSKSRHYYLASFCAEAKQLLAFIRGHWSIENSLHWVLDVVFREDTSRIRTGEAAANMAVLRHFALNLLNQETTAKGGVKRKRFKAALNDDYLLKVLRL